MDSQEVGFFVLFIELLTISAGLVALVGAMITFGALQWNLLRMSFSLVKPIPATAALLWPFAGLFLPKLLTPKGLEFRARVFRWFPWALVFIPSAIAMKSVLSRIVG